METIHYALDVYYTDKGAWSALQRRGMEQAEWILLPRAAETVAEKIGREAGNPQL